MAHRLSEKETKLAFPENENIGLLWSKVPMFCLESTEVFVKEVRCFQFPKSLKEAAPTLFSTKSFVFFSYISYTRP